MRPARLEAFSDGVFAIAITLLALEIHRPTSPRHLAHDLAALWPDLSAYVISFLLVGLIWANHHAFFEHIRLVDRMLLFANVLLLMDVALLPFTTSVLALSLHDHAGERTAIVLYGGTLVVGGIFFNWIWAHARRNGLVDPAVPEDTLRAISRNFWAGPLLYLLGTLLGAALPLLGLLFFAGLILVYWLPLTSENAEPVAQVCMVATTAEADTVAAFQPFVRLHSFLS